MQPSSLGVSNEPQLPRTLDEGAIRPRRRDAIRAALASRFDGALENLSGSLTTIAATLTKVTGTLESLISPGPRDLKEEALNTAKIQYSTDRFRFRLGRPWEDSEGKLIWGKVRLFCAKLLYYPKWFADTGGDNEVRRFDILIGLIIGLNLIQIVYETNLEANCYPHYAKMLDDCPDNGKNDPFCARANQIFLCIYVLEALFKIYVERVNYFQQKDNLLDFVVCAVGILTTALNSLVDISWLRVLRVIRLMRIFDIIRYPELRMLWQGFAGSMRAICFGMLLIAAMLTIFSIVLVQFIHPISAEIDFPKCERCSRGFSSVESSVLTLYKNIIAGDSWGEISVPVIEKNPLVGVTLCVVQLIVGVGVMNLILAVVVDRSVEARKARKNDLLRQKLEEQTARKVDLLQKVAVLDEDRSGCVSREEIRSRVNSSKGCDDIMKVMILADVTEKDLLDAFDLLDQNSDGEVSYLQLCDVLDDFQAADVRKLSVLTKLHLNQVGNAMKQQRNILQQHTTLFKHLNDKLDLLLNHSAASRGNGHSTTGGLLSPRKTPLSVANVPSYRSSLNDTGTGNDIGSFTGTGSLLVSDCKFEDFDKCEIFQGLVNAWQAALHDVEQGAIVLAAHADIPGAGAANASRDLAVEYAMETGKEVNAIDVQFRLSVDRLREESERAWEMLMRNMSTHTNDHVRSFTSGLLTGRTSKADSNAKDKDATASPMSMSSFPSFYQSPCSFGQVEPSRGRFNGRWLDPLQERLFDL